MIWTFSTISRQLASSMSLYLGIPYKLVITDDSDSWQYMEPMETGLPVGDHVGAFGVTRKNHVHEGVDLYCPTATPVTAYEAGEVVAVIPFTGEIAGSPWWHDTYAVIVRGDESGLYQVYGEIAPHVKQGTRVQPGSLVGVVVPVLKKDKGRPGSMLHFELRDRLITDDVAWSVGQAKPDCLVDPTDYLIQHANIIL